MKILMITEKDAANASLEKIADAFLRHGHYVEIYASYYDSHILSRFSERIPKYPLDTLTLETADGFDLIFASSVCGTYAEEKGLLWLKKPIFTQNYLIDKQMVWGGDYCFVPSLETVCTEYDDYFGFTRLATGEPKYDKTNRKFSEKRQILFIDSGHFPFGEQGKRELARTLLSICGRFPEYELVIKPRFLPGDKVRTHQNKLDLSQVLLREGGGKLPANLDILSEHRDLQELIEESHTVVCMYTTAFAGAVLADKGVVILDNLPSEDTYDIRKKVFGRVREQMAGSKALVDYHDVLRFLPHGIKAGREYKRFLSANDGDAAERICRETERRGSGIADWNETILRRYRDYIVYKAFIHTDYHAKVSLDIGQAYEKIRKFVDTFVRGNIEHRQENFHEEVLRFSLEVRYESILKNRELFMRDEIDAGIYLNALYISGKTDEILKFPDNNWGSVNYFKGMAYFESGFLKEAEEQLMKYAEKNMEREYIKEISDMSRNKSQGRKTLIDLLEKSGKTKQAELYRKAWI